MSAFHTKPFIPLMPLYEPTGGYSYPTGTCSSGILHTAPIKTGRRTWLQPTCSCGLHHSRTGDADLCHHFCTDQSPNGAAYPHFMDGVTWHCLVAQSFDGKKRNNTQRNQLIFLRKLARKTWAFFETFVGEQDNWLPPDNYQEHPVERIAHRTSPTNIGLSLLANLSAVDFGYLSTGKFIERTTNTIATMCKLERYKGHFYNWYDNNRSLSWRHGIFLQSTAGTWRATCLFYIMV